MSKFPQKFLQTLSLTRLSLTPDSFAPTPFQTGKGNQKTLHVVNHDCDTTHILGFRALSRIKPSTVTKHAQGHKLMGAGRLDLVTAVRFEIQYAERFGTGRPQAALIVAINGRKTTVAVRIPSKDGYSREYSIQESWERKTFPADTLFIFVG